MSEITIRIMNESDPEVISGAFHNQGWEKPEDPFRKYLEEQKDGQRVTMVAEVERDFAGYINVVWQSDYPYFKEHHIPEIQDFNVLIKYRRRGLGTMLMDKSKEIIRERSEISGLGVGLFRDYGAAQSRLCPRQIMIPYLGRGFGC